MEIEIPDVEMPVFKEFLKFLYTGTFPASTGVIPTNTDASPANADTSSANTDASPANTGVFPANECIAASLLPLADRYNVANLKDYCESELCNSVNADTISDNVVLSHLHG